MNEENITQINHYACELQEKYLTENDMLYPEALAAACQALAEMLITQEEKEKV